MSRKITSVPGWCIVVAAGGYRLERMGKVATIVIRARSTDLPETTYASVLQLSQKTNRITVHGQLVLKR